MISPTYPEEYLDIEFLAEILFNFMYNADSTFKTCCDLDPIKKNSYTIDDIKLILDKPRQKQLINNIFNTRLKWLWRKKNFYLFKRQVDVYSTNVQLKLVTDNDTQTNIKSSENMNSLVTWLLSDLVVTRKSKGILLNLINFDVQLELLTDFLDNYPEVYADFQDIQDKKNKLVNVTVMEHFFKLNLLEEIIQDLDWMQIQSIIFQVAHTLALAQKAYPGFRKNNLKCDTIYVYSKKPKTNIYEIDSEQIKMSDEGYEVKLSFFSESHIPGYAENEDIPDSKKSEDNTYDLLMLLSDLEEKVKSEDIKENIQKIIDKLQKNSKNIILSNIIMNRNFLGGDKHKTSRTTKDKNSKKKNKQSSSRVIKGFRYLLSNDSDSIFLKPKTKSVDDLPDSLSSIESTQSGGNSEEKFGNSMRGNYNLPSVTQPSYPMQQSYSMQPPSYPMQQPSYPMPPQIQSMQQPFSFDMMQNSSMMNSMYGSNLQPSVTNNDLIKLGIMPPTNLPNMPPVNLQGGNKDDAIYIDIANPNPNFFF